MGVVLGAVGSIFFAAMWKGIQNRSTWSRNKVIFWFSYLVWLALVVFGPRWNLSVLLKVLGAPIGIGRFGAWIGFYIPRSLQLVFFSLCPFSLWLGFQGFQDWRRTVKYQKALSHLGLKTPTGLEPKVVGVVELENKQRRVQIQAVGIDVKSFHEKKGAMESSFNAIVQEVRVSPLSRQKVEILISEKELPTLVRFDDCVDRLIRPYTFMVGEAMDGFVVSDLCEIHHMLIAGATGGGKSVFFKQALVGLLKSSKHIQLYLLDLKRGVDVKPFEVLENVAIAKDEASAIATLQAVASEMERRFQFLEKNRFTEIQPERDNLDRIVVAIDEASVLFTVEKSSKETKDRAIGARELTDKIAKLGRAAGIHLVLATQKVVKETIDTRVQTNINAKMCFRVNTVASSMTVLGNKKAAELPHVKGRGIWSVGSQDIVVQVPRLDNEEVIEEIGSLTAKFNGKDSPLKQPMLQIMEPKQERSKKLKLKDSEQRLENEREC